jgi:hypothetical protein
MEDIPTYIFNTTHILFVHVMIIIGFGFLVTFLNASDIYNVFRYELLLRWLYDCI